MPLSIWAFGSAKIIYLRYIKIMSSRAFNFQRKNQHAKEIELNELQAKEVIIILKLLYH